MPDPGLISTYINGQRIDRFADNSIQAAAQAVLANIPVDHNGVLLGVTMTEDSGQNPVYNAAIAFRIEGGWTIAAAYQKTWTNQGLGVWVGKSFK